MVLSKQKSLIPLCVGFLFIASLPTSKAGMVIFGSMLAIYSILFLQCKNNNHIKTILNVSSLVFLIGLTSSFASNYDINDVTFFIKKNLYLLIIPSLTYLLLEKKTRHISISIFVVATSISCLLSLYNFSTIGNFQISSRSLGFLDYSRHINVILFSISTLIFAISFPHKNNHFRVLFSFLLLINISSLIVSGTRGGWLGASVLITICLFLFFRKKSWYFFLAGILIVAGFHYSLPEKTNYAYERAASIFDTSKNESNTARLTMWKGGISYLQDRYQTNAPSLLFGSGMANSNEHYLGYISSLSQEEKDNYTSNGKVYGGTDFHNSFIDLLIKSGFIYGTIIILLFGYIILKSIQLSSTTFDYTPKICLTYFFGLITIIPFYSMFQEYSTYAISFSVSLLLGKLLEVKNES